MREIIKKIKPFMNQLGYEKKGNNYVKIKNSFYRIINFQKGARGSYFYINIGVLPICFPDLLSTEKLVINDNPKLEDCIVRNRVNNPYENKKDRSTFYIDDDINYEYLKKNFETELEKWFEDNTSFEKYAEMEIDEISKNIFLVPVIRIKGAYILKYFSYLQLGMFEKAKSIFEELTKIETIRDYSKIEEYLAKLMNK